MDLEHSAERFLEGNKRIGCGGRARLSFHSIAGVWRREARFEHIVPPSGQDILGGRQRGTGTVGNGPVNAGLLPSSAARGRVPDGERQRGPLPLHGRRPPFLRRPVSVVRAVNMGVEGRKATLQKIGIR